MNPADKIVPSPRIILHISRLENEGIFFPAHDSLQLPILDVDTGPIPRGDTLLSHPVARGLLQICHHCLGSMVKHHEIAYMPPAWPPP